MALSDVPGAVGESRVAAVAWWTENGVSHAKLRELIRSGDLVKTRRGVYATKAAVAESRADERSKHAFLVKSAIAATSGDSVACFTSAALILGLDMLTDPPEGVLTLLRPNARARNRSPSGDIVFLPGTLVPNGDPERWHVATSRGVRLTSTPRTVADLARTLPFLDAVVVTDSALRKYGFEKKDYLRILFSCRGWPGVEKAREVIRFGDPGADSAFESVLRVRLHEWGFDPPETQVVIPLGSTYAEADFLYRKQRTIVEADGKGKMRGDPDYSYKNRLRDQRLRDAGFKIAHVHWNELFGTPDVVIARIRKAFAAPGPF